MSDSMSYTGIFNVDPWLDDSALSDNETEGQRLCYLCKTITISGIRRRFVHHQDHDDLTASSQYCDSCYLLASTLVESPVLRWRKEHESSRWRTRNSFLGLEHQDRASRWGIRDRFREIMGRDDGNEPQDISPAVRIQDSRTRPEGGSPNDANRHGLNQLWITCGTLNQELRMYATSVRTSAKWRIPRPMNCDSESATALGLVRNWNNACLKKHKCKIEPSVLPTRVIDVGPMDGSQEPLLYVTKGEIGHWVSLSHCWGKAPILKTELANFDSMCRGIQPGLLPKTFKDSVKLTRELDIRYLWIDSICIIQDSTADWETEAAKMADVYKRAFLTIVAASAKDSHEGFFMKRPPLNDALAGLVFSNTGTLVKVFNGTSSQSSSETNWYGEKNSNIVDSRAWCLQEEALSTRLLKYNKTHMSWHCSGWSQMHEDGRESYQYGNWHRIPAILKSAEDQRLPDIWYRVLSNYTQRHMTFPKDKLPALAGIAGEFYQRSGDEYLAGIWKSQLPLAFMWCPKEYGLERESPQRKRSVEYRAPSWSWACIDGPVDFSTCTSNLPCETETGIKILDTNVTTKGINPFGEVRDCSISIQGRFKMVECGGEGTPISGYPSFRTELLDPSSHSTEPRSVGLCFFDIAAEKPGYQSKLWCLQVSALQGLLLVPSEESNIVFRRVGLFRSTDKGAWFEDSSVTAITIQ